MIRLAPALHVSVPVGGSAVKVADAGFNVGGGVIINPLDLQGQGVEGPEPLYVSLVGPANIRSDPYSGTVALAPGSSFIVPPGSSVWVNALGSGHQFTAYFVTPSPIPPAPKPVPGAPGFGDPNAFPVTAATGLTTAIPAYLYQEYSDDDDLQAFIRAVNDQEQNYVDTFNALSLPIYTGNIIAGALLDWVANGVYGYPRPALSSGIRLQRGPLNTWGPNWMPPIDGLVNVTTGDIVITDDDTYKRCLTWHYQKGDGRYFNIRWLKRRIMRFCIGEDGTSPPIDNTDQISISFGPDSNANIRFVLGKRTVTGGAMLNAFGLNGFGLPMSGTSWTKPIPLNSMSSTYATYPPLPHMSIFKEALEAGVLETPFQFDFTCSIG